MPSRHSAVAVTKRYLSESRFRIRLTDFVNSELEQTWEAVGGDQLAFSGGAVIDDRLVRTVVKKAEDATAVLCAIIATGAYWSDYESTRIWVRSIERLANPTYPTAVNSGYEPRLLPALFVMYAAGIGAVAGDRYEVLRAVLLDPQIRQYESESPVVRVLAPTMVLTKLVASKLADMERHKTPLSAEVQAFLLPLVRPVVPGEGDYVRTFDRFEYLLSLINVDVQLQSDKKTVAWVPIGCFGWRASNREALDREIERLGQSWPPLKAGLFDGALDRVREARTYVMQAIHQSGIMFS